MGATSEHFSAAELECKHCGANECKPELLDALELFRAIVGKPVIINSAYRCPALNSAVHSRPTSAHVDGLAVDFTCAAFGPPVEVCRAIAASTIQYDQIIHEFAAWTHLAIAHKGLIGRREMLTIDRTGTRFGLEK